MRNKMEIHVMRRKIQEQLARNPKSVDLEILDIAFEWVTEPKISDDKITFYFES